MRSDGPSEPLDLARGFGAGPEDTAALRRSRRTRPMSDAEYLGFLGRLPTAPPASLRSRHGPRGNEPFALVPRPTGK